MELFSGSGYPGMDAAATRLQSAHRGRSVRRLVTSQHKAATRLQSAHRGRSVRRLVKREHKAATKVQAYARGKRARALRAKTTASAVRIQSLYRGRIGRRSARASLAEAKAVTRAQGFSAQRPRGVTEVQLGDGSKPDWVDLTRICATSRPSIAWDDAISPPPSPMPPSKPPPPSPRRRTARRSLPSAAPDSPQSPARRKKKRRRKKKGGQKAMKAAATTSDPSSGTVKAAAKPKKPQRQSQTKALSSTVSAPARSSAVEDTSTQQNSALARWRKARVQLKSVVATVQLLADRSAYKAGRKQLSKTAHSDRFDVQAAYRELYFEDENSDAVEALTMKDDDWRSKAERNPFLCNKLVVIDNISRRLRATFTRLAGAIGVTDWFSVFQHYDTGGCCCRCCRCCCCCCLHNSS
jgi:hypothetical protein